MNVQEKRLPITAAQADGFLIPAMDVAKGDKRAWCFRINPKYWFEEGKRVVDAIELVCLDERFWDLESDYNQRDNTNWVDYLDFSYDVLFFMYCYSHGGIRNWKDPENWEKMQRIWDELHFNRDWLGAVKNLLDAKKREDMEYGLKIADKLDKLKEINRDPMVVKGVNVGDIRYAGSVRAPTAEEMYSEDESKEPWTEAVRGTAIGDYGLILLVNALKETGKYLGKEWGKEAYDFAIEARNFSIRMGEQMDEQEYKELAVARGIGDILYG